MSTFIGLIIAVVVILVCYRMHYRRRFDQVLNAYEVSSAAGRRPLIMLGALWFSYYDDHNPAKLPETVGFAGMVVGKGGSLIIFHEHKWGRVIQDY